MMEAPLNPGRLESYRKMRPRFENRSRWLFLKE
jgi:hypothetical protein